MIELAVVRTLPALAKLPEALCQEIARRLIPRRFAANAVLYRAGDPASALYFVLAGRVRVTRELAGAVRTLHHEGPGGVLGEIPMFGGGAYPATAVAAEETRCAVLAAADVEQLLRDEPDFTGFALHRMAVRARVLMRRLDELSAYGVTARLAAHLLARASQSSDGVITLGMSQALLADELGTAREVLVRSLRALCTMGTIRRAGRARFTIASLSALRAVAMPAVGAAGRSSGLATGEREQ